MSMTLSSYINQYVNADNAREYAGIADKYNYIVDITGLPAGHSFIEVIEDYLDRYFELKGE
jgi:hypothetical protein